MTKLITMKVEEDLLKLWKETATKENMTLSGWIKSRCEPRQLTEAVRKATDTPILKHHPRCNCWLCVAK